MFIELHLVCITFKLGCPKGLGCPSLCVSIVVYRAPFGFEIVENKNLPK
jgi:hypothetical protein